MKNANQSSSSLHMTKTAPDNVRTVLLVDDNADRRHLLRSQLSASGYNVLQADSGADALSMARRVDPDFLVADWDLPGLTGPDLYLAFRDRPRKSYGYVILITYARAHSEIARA